MGLQNPLSEDKRMRPLLKLNRQTRWGILALVAGILTVLAPTGALAQSLGGVSCSNVFAPPGVIAQHPSPPLSTNPSPGDPTPPQPLPPRYGFDYLGGSALVRNAPGSPCPSALNDFFVCVQTNGRPGDSDGDGVRNSQGGPCAFIGIDVGDGNGTAADDPLSIAEAWTLFFDRDCNGSFDLQLLAQGPNATLKVIKDDYTGKTGLDLGGLGTAFAIDPTAGGSIADRYTAPGCVGDQGHILVHIPNWDTFFAAPGLNPGAFSWRWDGGNNQDGPGEDQILGDVNLTNPNLAIDKTPDLTICEGKTGTLSIKVSNTGNTRVDNIAVTDVLPTGWNLVAVLTPGVTGSQVGNKITFSPNFSLDPCQDKTIEFTVSPNANCQPGDDVATAQGDFNSYCIQGGNGTIETQPVGPKTDTSKLVCAHNPKVSVKCEVPATVPCKGAYKVTATATNDGDSPADLTVKIFNGAVELASKTCPAVPAGGTCVLELNQTCDTPGTTEYTAKASAKNDCGTQDATDSKCSVECQPCGGNCPRTVGFWGAQCAQRLNGSTKFDEAHMTEIAKCVDSQVDIFTFDATKEFVQFCAIISPDKPMDCRKQAYRQFAGLLANYCAGHLGYKTSNGDSVFIDLNTANPCTGGSFKDAKTLGDLIQAIDDQLVKLRNEGADAKD